MEKKKTIIKKILLLIGVIVLIFGATMVYNFASWLNPKKTDIDISDVSSSDASSDIFIHQNTDGTDSDFDELINLMSENGLAFYDKKNNNGLIAKDDVVILKINAQWDQRGGTNVDLVRSVIDAIIAHPSGFSGEIIIADNGQDQFGSNNSGGSMDWKEPNAADKETSMQELADLYINTNVSTYLWDSITTKKVNEYDTGDMADGFVLYKNPDEETKITVSYPKFKTKFGTKISFKYGIWDDDHKAYDSGSLKVINMPVLKTHMIYGVTGAVKNYMGVPSEKLTRNAHSTIGIGSMGTLMVETRMPVLTVMDAIYINANTERGRQGPSTNYEDATFKKTVLVSTDPVALDYYAAGNLLYPAIKDNGDVLSLKHQRDSREVGSFGYWLSLSMNELHKGGYKSVMDEKKMNIYHAD